MSDQHDQQPPFDVTGDLLESYLLDRLSASARRHVEECVAADAEIAARMETARQQVQLFKKMLTEADAPARREECKSDAELAAFLDQSGPKKARAAAEAHLAECRKCQERLVQLHRELMAVRDFSCEVETVTRHPRGEAVALDQERAARRDAMPKGASADKREKPEKCQEDIDNRHLGEI